MRHYKKVLAVSLAASMVLGSSVVALAEDKEAGASGSGELEYIAKSDVFDVVFPTVAEDATTFDYILDPDGLIAATKGDKYTGKAFDDGKTMYFLRSEQVDGTVGGSTGKADYTDSSDEIKVVNKSTKGVELVVNAKVEAVDGITMKADTTFGTTDPELYLAIKGTYGTNAAETTAITAAGVEVKKTIAEDTAAYEVKWNSTDKQYEKQLTTAAQAADYAGFKTYTFQLTGACNQVAGWSALKDKAPKVDLVWSVKDFTVTGPQVTLSADGLITITGLTEEANVKNGATDILVGYADESDGNTTLYPVAANGVAWITDGWDTTTGGVLKVQLKAGTYSPFDGKSINVSVKLTDGNTITTNTTIGTVAQ